MPCLVRRFVSAVAVAVAVAALLAAPVVLHAQAAERKGAPEKGTWGAEAAVGSFESGSVLHFLSPQWAVLGSASLRTTRFNGESTTDATFTSSSVALGARRYGRTGLGLRPLLGFGASIGKFQTSGTVGGVYGEAGAAYFFSPHLSLGALGYANFSTGGGQQSFQFLTPRLLASLYF